MLFLVCLAVLGAAGFPGPESRADYFMDVELIPDSNLVVGSSRVVFTSGVDFPVDTLWLHLYPNAYRSHETPFGQDLEAVGRYGFRASDDDEKGWIDLCEWSLNGEPVEVHVDCCLGFIVMDSSLEPGATAVLEGNFKVHVPSFWSRMGHLGDTFQLTQWYPKMCVLDGSGWHKGRYHRMGEFYSDFGEYTVNITVPSNFITAATGRVVSTSYPADSIRRTDTWTAFPVHDFAWSASPDYTVREHTYVYPEELGGDSVDVHLVVLDDDPGHWADIPAVVDSTLLYYGEWYAPYPYRDLWVVEPAVIFAGGMEYPQFVFSAKKIPFTRGLELVTAHETGHQWFYGMLANDEVKEAWLDEGLNTFSEVRYMERRYGRRGNVTTLPGWLAEIDDRTMQIVNFVAGASAGGEVPVLSDATAAGDGSYSTDYTYYSKPSLFVWMLMDQVGEDVFNEAMSLYFRRFRFHHPHTEDFREIMEEVTGRSWKREFDFWLRGTGSADPVLEEVRTEGDSTVVTVAGDIPHEMEVDLLLVKSDDSTFTRISLSPGVPSTAKISGSWNTAVLDPFGDIPDRAPWNNSMPSLADVRLLVIPYPDPRKYTTWILPYPSKAAGSWRGDVVLMSAPLQVEMGGPFTWYGKVSIPFDGGGYSYWGTSARFALFRKWKRALHGSVGLWRGYGLGKARIGLGYAVSGRVPADPRYGFSLLATLFAVEDTTVYGAENVEEGKGLELSGGVSASDDSYRLCWNVSAKLSASPGWNGGPYARGEIEVGLDTRLVGKYVTRTRLYAGRVTGDAPLHVLLRPGGALFAAGLMGTFLPPDGALSPAEHYYVRRGPALPGYMDDRSRNRAAVTAEQRFPLLLPFPSLEVYCSGGWLADDFGEFSADDFRGEFGVSLRLAMMEALFPLWLSDPAAGEDHWAFRWRIGLHPAGIPALY